MGTLSIFGYKAHILIDRRSTHSIVFRTFAMDVDQEPKPLDCGLFVSTPTRGSFLVENVYQECMIGMDKHELVANFISL